MRYDIPSPTGVLDEKKLAAMGRAHKRFLTWIDEEVEAVRAFSEEDGLYAWDGIRADDQLGLMRYVQLNPDYWLARRWAESARHENPLAYAALEFSDHYLDRALAIYDQQRTLQLMALFVAAWAGSIQDLIQTWREALEGGGDDKQRGRETPVSPNGR